MADIKWSDLVNVKTKLNNEKFADRQDTMALTMGGQSEHMEMFNRFYLPEAPLYLDGLRGYIFFTRPDLNLSNLETKYLDTWDSLIGSTGITSMLDGNRVGLRGAQNIVNKYSLMQLQQDTGFPSAFMPIFTNTVKGYTPEDQMLDSSDKGQTNHGQKIRYGKHAIASRSSGTFTLTFEDTKYLPIFKTISVWMDYIEKVYLGDHKPKEYYVKQGILDYAVSMYYVVCRNYVDGVGGGNNKKTSDDTTIIDTAKVNHKSPIGNLTDPNAMEIVYWQKLVGVYPKNIPESAFATTVGEFTRPSFNVQFDYSMRSRGINDPFVLSELNNVSALHHDGTKGKKKLYAVPPTLKTTLNGKVVGTSMGNPFVQVPIIQRAKGSYYLSWNIFQ